MIPRPACRRAEVAASGARPGPATGCSGCRPVSWSRSNRITPPSPESASAVRTHGASASVAAPEPDDHQAGDLVRQVDGGLPASASGLARAAGPTMAAATRSRPGSARAVGPAAADGPGVVGRAAGGQEQRNAPNAAARRTSRIGDRNADVDCSRPASSRGDRLGVRSRRPPRAVRPSDSEPTPARRSLAARRARARRHRGYRSAPRANSSRPVPERTGLDAVPVKVPRTGRPPRAKGIYHVGLTDYPDPTYP